MLRLTASAPWRSRVARPARALALAVLAACGAPGGTAPLAPAGGSSDDGVGALARLSSRLVFDGAGDGDEERYVEEDRYQRNYDHDPLAYAGFGYGNFGYGGFGYGGFGYGGWSGGGLGYGRLYSRAEMGSYDARNPGDLGAVEGALAWKADGGVAWPADCALARTARTGAPVVGAVVYLERVGNGRSFERTGGVLTATPCGLAPSVQLLDPVPANVTVDNGAAQVARLAVGADGTTREHFELDPGGRVDLPVERAGVVGVEMAGGAPAWIVGQAHPYYAVTDAAGRFTLDLVPSGTHTLVVWSPPLVTAVTAAGPQWSAPTIERRMIVVPKHGVATVQVALAPAR